MPVPRSADPRFSLPVYRLLLRVYPRPFRARFGSLMQATFRDAVLDARHRAGARGVAALWLHTLRDLVRSATRERLESLTALFGKAVKPRPAATTGNDDAVWNHDPQPPAPAPATRNRHGVSGMATLLQDLRYAFVTLSRQRAFSVIAVLTLALGIGANVTLFSLVDHVLLQRLPFREPDRLVRIYGTYPPLHQTRENVSPLDVLDWREQAKSLAGVSMGTGMSMALAGAGDPVMVQVGAVSANWFDVLGVSPILGRGFTPEEEVAGKHRVALLTDGLWRSRFGADPGVVGRMVKLQGADYQVIGVLPRDFESPVPTAAGDPVMYRPLVINRDPGARGGHYLLSIARLRPGVSLNSARTEMNAITQRLAAAYPVFNTDRGGVNMVPLRETIAAGARRPLVVLFGAVAFLLFIACANVANLLLARASTRQREIAVRTALGARRSRILRQLFTENLLLALLAGVVGLALAMGALRVVPALAAGNLPRTASLALDARVVWFALGTVLLTALLFGMAPARRTARANVQSALRDGGRGVTQGGGRHLRSALVMGEVAMSLVLLVGAALLTRSFDRLLSVDGGFDRRHALTASLSLPGATYPETPQILAFWDGVLQRIGALPGVTAVGGINMMPLSGSYSCDSFALDDRAPPPAGQEPCAESRRASPDYFNAMGIALLRGRFFNATDRAGGVPAVIIDQSMAQQWWPGQDALGKRIKWGDFTADEPWRTVVGVVADVKHFGLDAATRPEIYMPLAQEASAGLTLVVRTTGDPDALAVGLRAAVHAQDPDLPVSRLLTLQQIVSNSVAGPRFRTILLAAFAGTALLLSLVGLYGVLAFAVAQRRHEFGIRMAVGAARGDVLRMVLRQAVGLVLGGLFMGVPVALLGTRALRGLLFGIGAGDAASFAVAGLSLLLVGLLASWLPARRATRVDPMIALRDI